MNELAWFLLADLLGCLLIVLLLTALTGPRVPSTPARRHTKSSALTHYATR